MEKDEERRGSHWTQKRFLSNHSFPNYYTKRLPFDAKSFMIKLRNRKIRIKLASMVHRPSKWFNLAKKFWIEKIAPV